jgi:hypothetical protein
MPPSPDTPLPIPLGTPTGASRIALLQALFDGHANGKIGTPQERLAALEAKAKRDRWLSRFRRLPLTEQGAIWLRVQAGDDLEELLPE